MSSQPHSTPTQDCPRLLCSHSWLPHIFFMTVIPFACVEWKAVSREEEQRLGALSYHAEGFGEFLVMFLEELPFSAPVGIHVVPQTTGQSKPTPGVGSNHPAPHSTESAELGYRKEAAV